MWKWRWLLWLLRNGSRTEGRFVKRMRQLHLLLQQELASYDAGDWVTHCVRPKSPPPAVEVAASAARIGIVIQGKVLTNEDFTLQTVRYYQTSFPNCPVYVTTWNDEEPALVRTLQDAGAKVVQSDPPPYKAPSHLNYQILSTLAGIRAAEADGCDYALKTRTDARIYATNVGDYLAGLIDQFPVQGTRRQRGRLAILDLATRLFIPFHPADILMFGYTSDMLAYWDTPHCANPKGAERPPCSQFRDLLNSLIPEVYLCEHHLRRIGYSFEPTLESWWQCLADLFVIVDRTAIEHFWLKYNYAQEHRATTDAHLRNEALCTFRDWLGIMNYHKQPSIRLEQLFSQRPNGLLRGAA